MRVLGSTGEPPTFQTGALPGCTVHFDWLKSWEAGAPVFPKHSDLNDQNLFHSTIDLPPGVSIHTTKLESTLVSWSAKIQPKLKQL